MLTPKLATGLSCLCSSPEKASLSLVFFVFTVFFICTRRIYSFNPGHRTTNWSLVSFSFKVCVNNSLPSRHIESVLPSFRSCQAYNSFLFSGSLETKTIFSLGICFEWLTVVLSLPILNHAYIYLDSFIELAFAMHVLVSVTNYLYCVLNIVCIAKPLHQPIYYFLD